MLRCDSGTDLVHKLDITCGNLLSVNHCLYTVACDLLDAAHTFKLKLIRISLFKTEAYRMA